MAATGEEARGRYGRVFVAYADCGTGGCSRRTARRSGVELIFRALFFGRYRGLFASERQAVAVNALVFGLAYLMFWNWVAVVLCAAGEAIFAAGYLRQGFVQAVPLHGICGGILFTSGLGTFLYHGAVG